MISSLSGLTLLRLLVIVTGVGGSLAFLLFGLASWRERERRAVWVSLVLAALFPLPHLAAGLLRFPRQPVVAALLLVIAGLALLVLGIPLGRPALEDDTPRSRVDERDIMFARWRLVPGSPEYDDYYARRPEKKQGDDRIRAAPGLLAPGSRMYHPFAFRAADASFAVIDGMRAAVDGPVAAERMLAVPTEMTRMIKGLARHYGAWSVGVTDLRDYHVYTHVGRGAGRYGEPIELDHDCAIAFIVEMDHQMVRRAPAAPAVMETSEQYLAAAAVALQLATFIRSLGYSARAHIDGDYQVICPLVARDAGLGEIGRMGLLMTPHLGPRVRIGVVTTSLPLSPDRPKREPAVVDFCRRCVKCAENCPSCSIPFDDRQLIDGVLRWRIDCETCFLYWNTIGTDCGRCTAVCPYSHPHTLFHGLVRWATRRSAPARWLALQLDDLFYGRRPKALDGPSWLQGP